MRLQPDSHALLPSSDIGKHYYAARHTAATPLQVGAPGCFQHEKFLFYRGVSWDAPRIAAVFTAAGKVLVRNVGTGEVPGLMWIESRGGKLGYRDAGTLRGQPLLDPPPLTASRDSMLSDLEGRLIAQGLYKDEARAMIATWQNSWFEEGSRLLYVMPAPAVTAMLPLAVSPPAKTVRVFVGRMELVTPVTATAVEQAFAMHDRPTLDRYKRFLEPILTALIAGAQADPPRLRALRGYLNSVYSEANGPLWRVGQTRSLRRALSPPFAIEEDSLKRP